MLEQLPEEGDLFSSHFNNLIYEVLWVEKETEVIEYHSWIYPLHSRRYRAKFFEMRGHCDSVERDPL